MHDMTIQVTVSDPDPEACDTYTRECSAHEFAERARSTGWVQDERTGWWTHHDHPHRVMTALYA